MDNKKHLLEECATTAAGLLGEVCERVVVLWDEEPAWPDKEQSPGDYPHGLCQSLRREVLRRRSLPWKGYRHFFRIVFVRSSG